MSDHLPTALRSPEPRDDADPGDSRRGFLRRSVVVAAPALALAAEARAGDLVTRARPNVSRSAPGASSRPGNVSATAASTRPSASLRNYFREIQADENAHVQELTKDLGSLAGPAPTFQNLRMNSINDFIAMSQVLENTGVGAYQGAAGLIQNKGVLAVAAAIAFVEAYHAGWLNSVVGTALVPEGLPFSVPLTPEQVVQRVAPFIASLNGPLPTLTDTPSVANDFAILNFALILERLEAEFYNLNVPRLFG